MSVSLSVTAEQYEQMVAKGAFDSLGKRIEMIEGEIREISPAGPIHGDLINFLVRWSLGSVEEDHAVVQVQSAVRVGDSLPEPDLLWLKPRRYGRDRPVAEEALLLIEVAESSLQYDLGDKASL